MRIQMVIETQRDASFLWDLLDSQSVGLGDMVTIAPGVDLTYVSNEETKSLDLPWTYHFVIELASGVTSVAAIGYWIYAKLKPKREAIRRIEIAERECELDEGQITRMIERKITIDSKE